MSQKGKQTESGGERKKKKKKPLALPTYSPCNYGQVPFSQFKIVHDHWMYICIYE